VAALGPVLGLGGQLEPPEMEKQIPARDQKLKSWLATRYSGSTWADVLRSPFWQKNDPLSTRFKLLL